jgi:protein-disulfide isomerase
MPVKPLPAPTLCARITVGSRNAVLAAFCVVATACSGDRSGGSYAGAGSPPAGASTAAAPTPDSVTALTDSIIRIADASRIAGNPNAKVWLVIMSDFQCPFCRRFHEDTYRRIRQEYVDRGLIRMAYLNFPRTYHAHAVPTAEYALCAGLQGKFWEYHDSLFKSQDDWKDLPKGNTTYFDSLAQKLGLDMDDLGLCVSSGLMKRLIAADEMRSSETGSTGTPAFVIGNQVAAGVQPFEVFKKYLDAALSAGGSGGAGGAR